ncbi:hypothetical protein GM661_06500 [Iocasia frigidifontis]|uniref:Uncharacterized protein n=1 Tax=Iocasia fonsfrigidae TaxID=2682810 RepID=A0A8A7KDH6_9FIRM|nr:hypothetical protein [Iocasia fonsfrigidae]MTI58474.1 hypothetical protein [Bacillota bacterium]QTL97658.1 hypothetical protein GM661_06500 [Iocasia fonsfrigidae]
MFLFEYMMKLLMGNSNTLFMGLIVVIFGYYGWLLWSINERLKNHLIDWDRQNDSLIDMKETVDKLDDSLYKELVNRLDEKKTEIEKIRLEIDKKSDDMDRYYNDIIGEIKESTDEIKEIMMILMNNRARGLRAEETVDLYRMIKEKQEADNYKKSN